MGTRMYLIFAGLSAQPYVRAEAVYAVRRLLEDMKRALETPALYARPAAERTLARHGSSVRPTEKP